ncbi:GNAT family N-acetyltransferase [Dyadobacter sp. CY347]|uniref:GNAT family N-acetyltransferase n=1 Tax=Dyadobacter sp. CY347 TaxID=2909336 RepID=UPI001F38CE49|nr:GNAT family N-acetyltransferase [Dyadobacter sp. CY347]
MSTQTTGHVYAFHLLRRNPQCTIAIFHCAETSDTTWFSPACAPFGGIQCADDCHENELIFFINCIKDWIHDRSGIKLTIKTAPFFYEPEQQVLLQKIYLNTGFALVEACVNSCIFVDDNDFIAHIKPAEKRRLRKSVLAAFYARLASEIPSVIVHEFLTQCRDSKGYRMPLTLSQIEKLRQRFPEECQIFGVFERKKILALTMTVRVNDQILYNFLSGDLPEYRVYSPVVMLMDCVYQYCQREKIRMLDLGISLDENGVYKPSLGRFKRNIGGQECLKMTYEINFR